MRKLILIVGLMLLFLSCSDKKIVNVENCKGNCEEKKPTAIGQEQFQPPLQNLTTLYDPNRPLELDWIFRNSDGEVLYFQNGIFTNFKGYWSFSEVNFIYPLQNVPCYNGLISDTIVWITNRKLYNYTINP